jgi:hypothetical protein
MYLYSLQIKGDSQNKKKTKRYFSSLKYYQNELLSGMAIIWFPVKVWHKISVHACMYKDVTLYN